MRQRTNIFKECLCVPAVVLTDSVLMLTDKVTSSDLFLSLSHTLSFYVSILVRTQSVQHTAGVSSHVTEIPAADSHMNRRQCDNAMAFKRPA